MCFHVPRAPSHSRPTHPVTHSLSYLPGSQINSRPRQAHTPQCLYSVSPGVRPGGNKLCLLLPMGCRLSVERWPRGQEEETIFPGGPWVFIYLMCMCIMCMYICAPCICHPLELEVQGVVSHRGCWEPRPSVIAAECRLPAPGVAWGAYLWGWTCIFPALTPFLPYCSKLRLSRALLRLHLDPMQAQNGTRNPR